MTLPEMLKTLRAPSDEAWGALTAWLEELDASATAQALPALQQTLADWPDHVQRSATQEWVKQDRAELLALCHAPGGLIIEVTGGGDGMAEGYARELVGMDRLNEAAIMLLDSVFEVSGDCDSMIHATPFSYGQVAGPTVALAPHIEARHAPTASTFRLDAIPAAVHEALRSHYRRCVEQSHEGQHDHRFVPLELRWAPQDLSWPPIGSAGDWFFIECVLIHAGSRVIYNDADPARYPTREFWPDLQEAPSVPEPLELLDLARDTRPSIATMLASQGLDELLTALLRVLEHFGVWAPSSFDDAYAQVLFELKMLPDPGGRAKRICETLTDFGHLEGPAVETVSGLLVCHMHELDVFRAQLQTLLEQEQLQLRAGGELEPLVPLCAWAVSAHRNAAAARGALAEALLEHPFVDDLFCEDAALLPHLG